jgi:hypothetical protein
MKEHVDIPGVLKYPGGTPANTRVLISPLRKIPCRKEGFHPSNLWLLFNSILYTNKRLL